MSKDATTTVKDAHAGSAGQDLGRALVSLVALGELDHVQAAIAGLNATPNPGPARDAMLAELRRMV